MNATRREFLKISGAAALLPGMAGEALAGMVAGQEAEPGTFFDWQEIARGVHAVADLASGGNTMVVVGRRASMLIDAKPPIYGPTVLTEARGLAPERAPLTTLVNTHHHLDHTGGNVAFAEPVEVLSHAKCRERVLEQFDRYRSSLRYGAERLEPEDTPEGKAMVERAKALAGRADSLKAEDWAPTETMEAYRRINLNGVTAQLYHVGAGHTDNDVFVRIPERNVVHAGDLVFHELHPFFDTDGGVSSSGWIESLNRLLQQCDDETVVVPGHGKLTDAVGVQKQIDYIRNLRLEVGKVIEAGKSEEEASGMTWPFMEGLGFERLRERAIRAVYAELSAERGGGGR